MSECHAKEVRQKHLNIFFDHLLVKVDDSPSNHVSVNEIKNWANVIHGFYTNIDYYDRKRIDEKLKKILDKCQKVDGKILKAEFRTNVNEHKLLIN